MSECIYKVLSFPVKLFIYMWKYVICVILYVIPLTNQDSGLLVSPQSPLAEFVIQKSEKFSPMEESEESVNICEPLTACVSGNMTSADTSQKSTCTHLTNNCLFFIKFHSDSGYQDAVAEIVKASFSEEEINIAYVSIREVTPESERKERPGKKLDIHKKITNMSLWLKTSTDIHICPENPYSLPPSKPADLNLVSVHTVAAKALKTSLSLSKSVEEASAIPGMLNDLSTMKAQIDEMRRQQEDLLASLSTLNALSDQLLRPSPTGMSTDLHQPPPHEETSNSKQPHPSVPRTESPLLTAESIGGNQASAPPPSVPRTEPPLPTAESTGGNKASAPPPSGPRTEPTVPTAESTGGNQASTPPPSSPSTSYSEAVKSISVVVGSGWQTQGRNKRVKPIAKQINMPSNHNNSNRSPDHRRFEKRCHIVIHNLHSSVTMDDIKTRVNLLTGADPLILHEVQCKIRNQVAFRVSCLFQHREVLVGENFGKSARVSFYHLRRDQVPRSPPCTLGPIPSQRSSPSPSPAGRPTPSTEEISSFISQGRLRTKSWSH